MEYRFLGNTNERVSLICLGTMNYGEQNSEKDAHEQLSYAIDKGINFIDTAEMYAIPPSKETQGLTEKYIGTWLKNRPYRDKIILASKIAGPSSNLKYIRDPLNFKPHQIREALENSLKRLQTDYLDLYQLHWPERRVNNFGKLDFPEPPENETVENFHEILSTFKALIDEGKIRYFGVSNDTPWGIMKFLETARYEDLPRCVSIQNPYNLLNRSYEIGLAEISIREKAGLLAYSPLAFGRLSGKFIGSDGPEGSRINKYPKMKRYNSELAKEATKRYVDLARKYDIKPAQMALAFINSRPFLTSTIIGARTMEQLKENMESFKISLNDEIINEINAIHKQIPNPAP